MACYEFAGNGASLVHGCDINEEVIFTARSIFADVPNVNYRFEVVDLAKGPKALDAAFSNIKYDIILLLAIYHKLKRVADPRELLFNVARRCNKYIGWRGYSEELSDLEEPFKACGFKRIQYSEISESICPAAIWRRG